MIEERGFPFPDRIELGSDRIWIGFGSESMKRKKKEERREKKNERTKNNKKQREKEQQQNASTNNTYPEPVSPTKITT